MLFHYSWYFTRNHKKRALDGDYFCVRELIWVVSDDFKKGSQQGESFGWMHKIFENKINDTENRDFFLHFHVSSFWFVFAFHDQDNFVVSILCCYFWSVWGCSYKMLFFRVVSFLTILIDYRLPPIVARAWYFRLFWFWIFEKLEKKTESNPHSKVARARYLRFILIFQMWKNTDKTLSLI